jgi:hypothetical protein
MSFIEKITTHVEDGLGNMLTQFQDKPRFVALMTAILVEIQRLEDVTWEVLVGRFLDVAEGVNLDRIGELVNWPRLGLPDDDYRRLIKVAVQILRHDCEADDTAKIWSQLLDGEPAVRYLPHPPAHFQLSWSSGGIPTPQSWLDIIVPLMPLLACMGVSWELIEASDDDSFIFDTDARAFDSGKFSRRVD